MFRLLFSHYNFSEKDKKELRQLDVQGRGKLIKSIDRLKQNLSLDLEGAKDTIDKAMKKTKSNTKKQVLDLMDDAYKILIDSKSSRVEVMDAIMSLYSLMPELFEGNSYYISMYSGTSLENTLPKDIVDILTKTYPIDILNGEVSAQEKQDILDLINSITYDSDKSQKYNATFGKNNKLFIYQNVEAKQVFSQDFFDKPLEYIHNLLKKNKTITIYDIVNKSYKFSKDAETILKNTNIYISEDIDFSNYDIGINTITISIHPDKNDIYFSLSTDVKTKSDIDTDIKNSIYHEVNHALRSVSSNERYSPSKSN